MPSGQYVDQRIVEMQIDNKKFESGAKKTISTLEKLEKALHLKSDTKALDDVERSMSKFDTSDMTRSLDKVQMSFSALEVAGLRVIQNLTDAVYGFVSKTVKGLTIDQVSAGWNKYEKMIESTQTIMAATQNMIGQDTLADGTKAILDEAGAYRDATGALVGFMDQASQMGVVQDYLDGLLWFSDETSYSFTDMTDNMGKFLSAGVDLEKAYKSMMGIASWGATAGAKPAEVARAMYNISQAMGTGAMKNIDWKSIENANMATLAFKQTAIDVASDMGKLQAVTSELTGKDGMVGLGVAVDETGHIIGKTDAEVEDMFITAENFRDSLQSGWFDKEVMQEVFSRYGQFAEQLRTATDATGLEATEILQILDKYRKQGEKFNWDKYAKSARMTADELHGIVEELDNIGVAYDYSEQGFRRGQEAKTFTDAVEATKDAVSSRWMETFKYIFGDYLQAKEFWTQVTTELYDLFAAGGDVRNEILEAWSELDEFGRSGRDYLLGIEYDDDGEVAFRGALWNLVEAVHSVTRPIKEAFAEAFGLDETQAVGEWLRDLTKRFQEFTNGAGLSENAQNDLKAAFKSFFTVLKSGIKVTGEIIKVFVQVASVVTELAGAFNDLVHGRITIDEFAERARNAFLNMGVTIKEGLKSLLPSEEKLLSFYEKAKNKYLEVKQAFSTGFTWDNIKALLPTWDGLSSKIQEVGNYLSQKYPKISAAFQEWRENHTIFGSILDSLKNGFSKVDEFLKSINIDTGKVSEVFREFAGIIGEIFGVLFGDPQEIKQKVINFVTSIQDGLKESFKDWTPKDYMRAIRTAGFTAILVQIGQILAGFKKAIYNFASIKDAIDGLFGGAIKLMDDYGKQFRANAYIKMAIAVGILAASLWVLSKVPEDRLTDVAVSLAMLVGVTALLAKSLSGFMKFVGGTKITLFNNFASILFGFAALLGAIAAVILIARKTDTSKLIGIAVGVVAALAILSAIAKGMSAIKFNDAGGVVGSLLAMAFAIQMMIPVLVVLALMPEARYYNAIFGVIGLFTGLGILVVAMDKFAQNGQNLKQVAGAMAIMALALDAMIPVMLICAALGGAAYGKAFVQVLGMFALLGGMAVLISKFKINGKNFLLLAAGMVALALAIDLMMPAVVGLTAAITGFAALVPWGKITKNLGGFWKAFGKLAALATVAVVFSVAVAVAGAGVMLFGAGLMFAAIGCAALSLVLIPLAAAVPAFIKAINEMESIKYGKIIAVAVAFGVLGLALAGVILGIGKIANSRLGTKLSMFFANLAAKSGGVGDKISEKISQSVPKILQILGGVLILAGLYFMDILPQLVDILVQSIITLFDSVADSVEKHRDDFVDSVMRIIKTFLGVASDILGKLFDDEFLDTLTPTEKGLLNVLKLLAGIKLLADAIKLKNSFAGVGSLLGGGGTGGAAAAGAGGKALAEGAKPLISTLADVKAAAALGGEALAGMSVEAGGSVLAFGSLTAVGAGLLAALGLIPVALLDNKLAANYASEALNGLGTSTEDITAKAVELANTWKEGEAALYDYTGTTTVSLQESRYAQEALAQMLGITTGELERQMAAANNDVTQIQALKDMTQQYTETSRTMSEAEELHAEKMMLRKQKTDEVSVSADNAAASVESMYTDLFAQTQNGELSLDQFKSKLGEIETMFGSFGQNVDFTDIIQKFTDGSYGIGEGSATGVENSEGLFVDAIDGMSAEGLFAWLTSNAMNSPSAVYSEASMGIPEGVAQGVSNGSNIAIQAIVALTNNMMSAAVESFNANGAIAGSNAVIGVANGAYANLQIAYDAGAATGNAFMKGYDDATKTQSPSREMMKRGLYAIQGLIQGLHDNSSDVYDEAGTIGFGIINTVQSAMAQVAMLASEQFDISPVITPVVDMTNITAATGSINGALSGAHIGLSGEITSSVSRRLDQAERVASNVEARNETINNNGDVINFNIYTHEGMDENEIADAVMVRMQSRMVRRGAAFG